MGMRCWRWRTRLGNFNLVCEANEDKRPQGKDTGYGHSYRMLGRLCKVASWQLFYGCVGCTTYTHTSHASSTLGGYGIQACAHILYGAGDMQNGWRVTWAVLSVLRSARHRSKDAWVNASRSRDYWDTMHSGRTFSQGTCDTQYIERNICEC